MTTLKPAPQESAVPLKLSGVDKDLVEKKKKAEEAVLALRKTEEERVLKSKVENCARAKQAKAGFDSGMRITRSNEKGEREASAHERKRARAGTAVQPSPRGTTKHSVARDRHVPDEA